MLSKEEKQWLKVFDIFFLQTSRSLSAQDHNQRCRDKLEPYLKDDKRALKWLRREAERGIGFVGAGPGGISIDWD
jgi:Xaa-Pro aminopeptidase